jgi:TRAP-type C4-dicarboxylate transport system permease large subunit
MFMDITAALIILAPVLAPVAIKVGVDPLHFGVMMCINLSIGLITPPVGACLFVATSISKLKYEEVIREVWPFIIVELVVLAALIYIPELTMLVPRALGLAAP